MVAPSEPCPFVLVSDSPSLETAEGEFTLERVEVWTAPNCLADPWGGGEVPSYLVVYTWTNTSDAPVRMGANYGPLYPYLAINGNGAPFMAPVIEQSMVPYEEVEPGDSVTFEHWHTVGEGQSPPRVPNEIYIYPLDGQEPYDTTIRLTPAD